MDSVEIRGLSCRCIIGILARERRVAQPVQLDLDLALDLERAGKSGRIAHTVDYARACSELIALLQFRRYTLLEVAAEECAGWLFASHAAIRSISLSINKPQALAGQATSGGVRITRQRAAEGAAARRSAEFGFVEPQLETSEASILRVELAPGSSVSPRVLGAEAALILPLAGQLEARGSLTALEPARLTAAQACTNRGSAPALLVACAKRRAPA